MSRLQPAVIALFAVSLAMCPSWRLVAEEAGQPEPAVPAEPTPQAQLNDLVAEYTFRYQFGSTAEAIPAAIKALAQAEQMFGRDHEQVAQILNDLGFFYHAQREFAKAQALHERALRIRERVFHGEGAAVVQSLVNLAKAHAGRKHYGRAQPLFERALAIAERNVPPTDHFLLGILEPYAATLRGRRNTKAAHQIDMRIAQIRTAQPGAKPSINDVLK